MKLLAITSEVMSDPRISSDAAVAEVCEQVIAMYGTAGPVSPWFGYLAEDELGMLVGTCAFKSPPSSRGVEIAYFTFPEYEGRGYATSMARRLIDIARAGGCDRVAAQTLPQLSASTRILQKLGFVLAGTEQHPDDGEVWEWVLYAPKDSASNLG